MTEQDTLPDREEPAVGIGHNSNAFLEEARRLLRASLDPIKPRRDQFLEAAKKVVIRDRHDAGAAADLIGLARDVGNIVDEHRRRIGKPHDDVVRTINSEAKTFWEDVEEAMGDVQEKIDAFAAAEQAKIDEQKASQERDEAARRAALAPAGAPPPPEPAPPARQPKKRAYRGDLGRQAVLVDQDQIEIVDVRALPDLVLNTDRVHDAIRAVLRPLVKSGAKIDGIKVTKAVKSQIRK